MAVVYMYARRLGLYSEDPMFSGSGVQKKGRFLVVNDVSDDPAARPPNSSSETESLAEAQAQVQQQQLLFSKDVVNQTKASPPPQGESLRRDSSTSSVHSQVSAQPDVQAAAPAR